MKKIVLLFTLVCTMLFSSVVALASDTTSESSENSNFCEIIVGDYNNTDYYIIPDSSYLDLEHFKSKPSAYLENAYNYYIMLHSVGGGRSSFYVYTCDKPFSLVSDNGKLRIVMPSDSNWNYYTRGSSGFVKHSEGYNEDSSIIYTDLKSNRICSFNHDLYLDGQVFFSLTPSVTIPIVTELKVTTETLLPTTKEIISLLPLLIPLVVSFLGLRKGWKFLKTTLESA